MVQIRLWWLSEHKQTSSFVTPKNQFQWNVNMRHASRVRKKQSSTQVWIVVTTRKNVVGMLVSSGKLLAVRAVLLQSPDYLWHYGISVTLRVSVTLRYICDTTGICDTKLYLWHYGISMTLRYICDRTGICDTMVYLWHYGYLWHYDISVTLRYICDTTTPVT